MSVAKGLHLPNLNRGGEESSAPQPPRHGVGLEREFRRRALASSLLPVLGLAFILLALWPAAEARRDRSGAIEQRAMVMRKHFENLEIVAKDLSQEFQDVVDQDGNELPELGDLISAGLLEALEIREICLLGRSASTGNCIQAAGESSKSRIALADTQGMLNSHADRQAKGGRDGDRKGIRSAQNTSLALDPSLSMLKLAASPAQSASVESDRAGSGTADPSALQDAESPRIEVLLLMSVERRSRLQYGMPSLALVRAHLPAIHYPSEEDWTADSGEFSSDLILIDGRGKPMTAWTRVEGSEARNEHGIRPDPQNAWAALVVSDTASDLDPAPDSEAFKVLVEELDENPTAGSAIVQDRGYWIGAARLSPSEWYLAERRPAQSAVSILSRWNMSDPSMPSAALLATLLFALLGAGLNWRWFDRQILNPLKTMATRASKITGDSGAIHQEHSSNQIQEIDTALLRLEDWRDEKDAQSQAALLEMRSAGRAKDEFLATMSHELRTPLTAILGLSETLSTGVYGPLNPRQTSRVQRLHASGLHLLSLVNDLLDVTRIEIGELRLDYETVSTKDLCDASLGLVQGIAEGHQIQLEQDIAVDVGSLRCDPRRMKQALVNLLNNAIKFTPSGGRVSLKVVAPRESRNQIAFIVTDSGIGIEEGDQERIFEPFEQLDQRLARSYEGAGLGLALVKRIVELHGGYVELESQPGTGSVFTLYMPSDSNLDSDSLSA